VFTDVYLRKAWIHPTTDRDLYSGPGSNPEFAAPYAEAVRRFAEDKGVKTIVDLGCGDFRVGRRIARPPFRYVGVDVVDVVVDYNTKHYAAENIEFLRRDICLDPLPGGDLCLVREVFQHLCNDQILAALKQMRAYRWCLVTDRHSGLEDPSNPNVDHPQGAEGRTSLASALRFDRAPFNRPSVELLFDVPAPTRALPGSTIRTYLISH
jgi:SAM-dependent methyltransferase